MRVFFSLLLILSAPVIADDAGWCTLFDGETLTGWESTSDANWRVEDGSLVVDEGEGGLLIHEDTYRNYELTVEFKAAKGTNSGVFLSTKEKPKSLTKDCYELNIAPPDNAFPTGSLVAREKVEGAGETDDWRKFEVRVENGRVTVKLDGETVLDHRADPPSQGNRIGLQKNSGRVAFRNVRVRKLP
ncbi:MAG: DUF1080 domain-containing protein [Verrucomicrobiales bacterium]|nr:DUF1080 domain-containing protein [Verrucomicrobiales bacterium]